VMVLAMEIVNTGTNISSMRRYLMG
jgi:hypothetical protein